MTIRDFVDQGAIFSTDGLHRFRLFLDWEPALPKLALIMLNPSTADGVLLDPTMRTVLALAEAHGFGSVDVANLYSRISSDPRKLPDVQHDLWREETDQHMLAAASSHARVVLGWGRAWSHYGGRQAHVLELLRRRGQQLHCFGQNKDGSPKHPLYLPHSTQLRPFTCP